MPTISRNKPARTEAQMFPLVESWLHSNLTQKEFSIQQGLSPHVLPYWINRYRQQAQPTPTNQEAATVATAAAVAVSSPAPASFIRLDSPPANTTPVNSPLATPSAIIPETTAMAVELPSGVVLRFPSLIPIAYLQEVVLLCSR